MKNLKYILLIITLGIFLGITSYTIKNNKLNIIEKSLKDTGVYIEKIFNKPIQFFKDKIEIYNEKKDLYKKYTLLKEKEENTNLYIAQLKEKEKEISDLKKVVELNATLSEYNYVNANVVNRNVGYWYNNLTIDKGKKDGIKEGDAVIVSDGLIGRIDAVSNHSSTVKLLTTDEILNKISVKIGSSDNYLYGLLYQYDKDLNLYKVEGITNPELLKEGELVTTTGLTDYFPSGIIIGSVFEISKDEYDLNSIVKVKPSVNFDSISIVTVLKKEVNEE